MRSPLSSFPTSCQNLSAGSSVGASRMDAWVPANQIYTVLELAALGGVGTSAP